MLPRFRGRVKPWFYWNLIANRESIGTIRHDVQKPNPMKFSTIVASLVLMAVLTAMGWSECSRADAAPQISDFWLEVTPPDGSVEEAGFFGLQIAEGAVLSYDLASGRITLDPGDEIVPNAPVNPDQLFFDRFQVRTQDRSGFYNPLVCFDLAPAGSGLSVEARDLNNHLIIGGIPGVGIGSGEVSDGDGFFLDEPLEYDLELRRVGFSAPESGACFYRALDGDSNHYGSFGLFGVPSSSAGLSVTYDVPASVVLGGTLNYERVITNTSGETLEILYQEVFPANPAVFTSASFPASESQVRGRVTLNSGLSDSSSPVSRSVPVAIATPGEYLDLYFAVAAQTSSGALLAVSEHRRVLVTAADAGQSEISATPTAGLVADGDAEATISVIVRDPEQALVEGQVVTFALTGGDAGAGGLSSTSVTSGTNGVAEVSLTSTRAETLSVSAYLGSSVTGPLIGTVEVTFLAGAAAALGLTGSVADLASGEQRTLSLAVVDVNGNLVDSDSGRIVAFQQAGAGSVTGLGDVTTELGLASLVITGNAAGPVTITATTAGLADDSTGLAVVPGPTAGLVFVSVESDLASSTQRALTVQLQDAQGNPIEVDPGIEVDFSQLGGAGALQGLGSTTSSAGFAVLSVTGTTAGIVEVEASGPGLTPDTTTFEVVPGTATKLVFSNDQDPVAVGAVKTLVIEIQDANDNRVTSDTRTVNLAKALGSGSGVVDPMSGPVVVSSGVVELDVVGETAGQLTLNATVQPGDPNPIASANTTFSVTDI